MATSSGDDRGGPADSSRQLGDGVELKALVAAIPEGWSRARIGEHSWGVTRTTHADGRAISVDAERLGGTEALGANVWITSHGALMRPCEIPAETVWQFLRDLAKAAPGPLRTGN
ncbi:hypothetical protein [Cellulosimicrobium sp. CpK407]|uniref:hypothetical protein n=1 Tax=Cellulosimicrobium sp. CpK407 TaxID=3229847 RepID=UPI003F3547BA